MTLTLWKEVLRAMTYTFKPTDALVKGQVLLLVMGVHKSMEDVPNLYNLREAVAIAMGLIPNPDQSEEEQV